MKTKLFFLACAVVACGCNDLSPQKVSRPSVILPYPDTRTNYAEEVDNESEEETSIIGTVFSVNAEALKNIAITGKILDDKDDVDSGELILTDKTTKKVIQKLPYKSNNRLNYRGTCVEIADFDFDGNLDIIVPNGWKNKGLSFDAFIVYLYNTTSKQFEKNNSIGKTVSNGYAYEVLPSKQSLIV
jgi:hypothetical protein